MPGLRKWLKIILIVAAIIILVFYLQKYGIEPLQNAVEKMGFWAPLGLFLLRGISIILPALPSSIYSLLGITSWFQNGISNNCSGRSYVL